MQKKTENLGATKEVDEKVEELQERVVKIERRLSRNYTRICYFLLVLLIIFLSITTGLVFYSFMAHYSPHHCDCGYQLTLDGTCKQCPFGFSSDGTNCFPCTGNMIVSSDFCSCVECSDNTVPIELVFDYT